MAIALTGLSPSSNRGEKFFCNSWEWNSLAEYLHVFWPVPIPAEINLHFLANGQEITREQCLSILPEGSIPKDGIDPSGIIASLPKETREYLRSTAEFLDSLGEIDCQSCLGVGKQRAGIISPDYLEASCRECGGIGKSRPYIRNYKLAQGTVLDFFNFMKDCGGFSVEF